MGRAKLPKEQKKKLLRVFVTEKVIKANGGMVKAVKRCVELLEQGK